MELISVFANNPDILTPDQINELKTALIDTIKHKISKTENKYNIKFKFPKNICNINKTTTEPLNSHVPIFISPFNLSLYTPLNITVDDFSNEDAIDNISSCMKIVNSVKYDLENVENGNIKKENIDTTFFTWINENNNKPIVYDSEIEELYEKKFGNKALLNNLIQEIQNMNIM
jgi:hypothetical protein